MKRIEIQKDDKRFVIFKAMKVQAVSSLSACSPRLKKSVTVYWQQLENLWEGGHKKNQGVYIWINVHSTRCSQSNSVLKLVKVLLGVPVV